MKNIELLRQDLEFTNELSGIRTSTAAGARLMKIIESPRQGLQFANQLSGIRTSTLAGARLMEIIEPPRHGLHAANELTCPRDLLRPPICIVARITVKRSQAKNVLPTPESRERMSGLR